MKQLYRKILKTVFFTVSIMIFILLMAGSSFAFSDTEIFINSKHGVLTGSEILTKKFTLPAKANVTINFMDDYYEDLYSEGAYIIEIVNSNGKSVFYKKDTVYWESKKHSVKDLPKGEYTLTISVDSNIDFYGDWLERDYVDAFEEMFEDEFDALYEYEYGEIIDWEEYEELKEEAYKTAFKEYIDQNKALEYYISAEYTVTEKINAKKITLNKSKMTLTVGGSEKLKTTVSPAYVNTEIKWSSSNTKVATVDKNGKVKAKSAGTATITVKNGKVTAKCKVTVKDITAKKIKLNKTKLSLEKGKTYKLKATVSPENVTAKTTWSSSNSKVVTVDKKGKIKAKALGTATVTVKNGKKKVKCTVTVKSAKKTVIRKKSSSLVSLVKNIKGYKNAKWSSSDKKIATVTSAGKVTGKAKGTCKIYCTVGKVKYTINVTVKDAVSASVYKTYDANIYNETIVKIKNNTDKDITYITLNITQYDNRGYKLKSPYSYYYYNDTLPSNETHYLEYWTNDDTKKAKVTIKKVWFSDGSTWTP